MNLTDMLEGKRGGEGSDDDNTLLTIPYAHLSRFLYINELTIVNFGADRVYS